MKNFYKTFIGLITLFSLNGGLYAASFQPQDGRYKKAVQAYQNLNYASAISLLKPLVEQDSSRVELVEMLAYSYKMVKDYPNTLRWYQFLVADKNIKPEWLLYFAEALANNQQYEKSVNTYREYLKKVPKEKRASSFVNANLQSFEENKGHWIVQYTNLNSQGSDYAPAFYNGGLIFSSNRMQEKLTKRVFGWENSPFSDLFSVDKLSDIQVVDVEKRVSAARNSNNKGYRFNDDDTEATSNDSKVLGIYRPTLERDTILETIGKGLDCAPLPGKVNTPFNEGTAAAFPDGSIIFTRNNYFRSQKGKSSQGISKLKMYIAGGPNFRDLSEFPYNSNEYSVGHPALNTDGTILVFVSDMPLGYGGTDLYYCIRSGNGQWTRPVNMGKNVNTEGDEMFPYLTKDGNLLFSSTGYAGLGGLDVFELPLKDMKPQAVPKNMGSPINSAEDDFSLIIDETGKQGYFSSNRLGNDDIYRFSRNVSKVILRGTVKDGRLNIPLAGSRILMRHLDGVDTLRVNARGEFERELKRETDYELTAQKLGYVHAMNFVTSVGIEQDSVINLDIKLFKTESNQQWVINHCDSLKRVFAVDNIYYDLDKAAIRADAVPALEHIVDLMRQHPEVSLISASHCDSRASEEYNRNLSLRRGYAAKDYLVSRGINAERIRVEYYGKTRLTNRCYDGVPCSELDQQMNRRTEFEVIINGINLSQLDCDLGGF